MAGFVVLLAASHPGALSQFRHGWLLEIAPAVTAAVALLAARPRPRRLSATRLFPSG
jgi:hypothetical protein